jgi:hypothetical protein
METVWETLYKRFFGRYTERSFVSTFGTWIPVCDEIRRKINIKPLHLLMALHFLRQYLVVSTIHVLWQVCEKTYRSIVWDTLLLLERNLDEV